ncbi:GTP cyclohydrolase II [Mobilitalea sibirica]|uniref:GTP cyclohydrolase-2 n=1 Tax=Mobilitalea sibirica TaxID=1462919 RepID=A0A8J7KWC7_9FIRM|nr:GTP cyclohydrolase II [Mobilitalea sibirica]MBH1940257.1 GTP cyclohydrolase II [Mobilitalea sibirica]
MIRRTEDGIKEIKKNSLAIIIDDEQAENGGVLFAPAEAITIETMQFLMKYGTGFTYATLTEDLLENVHIPQVNTVQKSSNTNSYDLSIDHIGAGSGISAENRLLTIQKLLEDSLDVQHFKTPGHVFIIKAVNGGVLKKAGMAEAVSDLATIAGYRPFGVYTEILSQDKSIATMDELQQLSDKENIPIFTIEDLIAYRREKDCYVIKEAEANLPTEYGDFRMVGFVNKLNGEHHVAMVKGIIEPTDEVLVRVHSECLTGDAFHSLKCDCGEQLAAALMNIEKEGKGVLLYLRQEGRGIGLINKIKAYKLQEQGMDTEEANIALGFPSDMRDYGIGAQILSELNVRRIRLMTNNPKKIIGLKGHGIEIIERVPLIIDANVHNKRYFETKKEKMGHLY